MISIWASRGSKGLACAIICFCVSRGRSRRCNRPLGLSIMTDLPFERLLGPGASGLDALIASGVVDRDGLDLWVKDVVL